MREKFRSRFGLGDHLETWFVNPATIYPKVLDPTIYLCKSVLLSYLKLISSIELEAMEIYS